MSNTLSILATAISTLVGTAVAIATYTLDQSSRKLEETVAQQNVLIDQQRLAILQQEAAIKAQTEERLGLAESRRYQLQVYEKVVEALNKRDDDTHQQTALVLVLTMPTGPFRDQLLQAISIAPTAESSVKQRAVQELNVESQIATDREDGGVDLNDELAPAQAVVASLDDKSSPVLGFAIPEVEWDQWDIDVFWCESARNGETAATHLVEAMRGNGAEGRLRARVLLESTNARTGYNVSGFQVRMTPDETPFASQLAKFATHTLGSAADFGLYMVGTSTPNYVSVFICGDLT